MLKSIKLHNFKTFLNAEFHFAQRNLLLGKNNSGKTNLTAALRFLSLTGSLELERAAIEAIPGGLAEICNRQLRSNDFELSCRCTLDFNDEPSDFEYSLVLTMAPARRTGVPAAGAIQVAHEELRMRSASTGELTLIEADGKQARMLDEEASILGGAVVHTRSVAPQNATVLSKLFQTESNQRAILFRDYFRKWWYFSFSPLAIRQGSPLLQDSIGGLDPYGRLLANSIFVLKNVDERRYRRIIKHVQLVEPTLEAINYLVAPNQAPVAAVHLSDSPRASWNGLSDGTLRVLALAYCIELASFSAPPEQETAPFVMIEEPENGVFPGQLRQIYDLFEEWAPTSQFLFTSHSPYFIDMFNDKRDSVTILRRAADRTEIAPPILPDTTADEEDQLTLSMQYASELYE